MKRLSVFLFLTAFVFPAFAQNSDSSVVFNAHFLKNEYQSYVLSKSEFTIRKKDTLAMEKITMKAEVVVADSSQNGYILKWKLSGFSISTPHQELKKLVSLAEPVLISYKTSKTGSFSEFLDDNKVTSCLEKALPKVLEAYKNRTDSVAKAEVARIYAFRDNLEGLMMQFAIQFHQFHGLGYNVGETVNVPVEINSRFSTRPLPGIQRKKLVGYDAASGLAQISYATILDMAGYRKALSENMNISQKELIGLMQNEIGGMMIDVKTGWPVWNMQQREAVNAGLKLCEQIEIQYNKSL